MQYANAQRFVDSMSNQSAAKAAAYAGVLLVDPACVRSDFMLHNRRLLPAYTILPMGGDQSYKGFGLSLMIDIFSGALSAGLCARETPLTPKGNCVFLMVIDPARLGGLEAFQREVNQISDFVKSCPTRDPNGEILLPGDPERKTVAANTANGIAIDDENWSKLTELAQSLSVDIPQL